MNVTLECFTDSGRNASLAGCRPTGGELLADPKAGNLKARREAAGKLGF